MNNSPESTLTRRNFLANSAGAAVAASLLPRTARATAASADTIDVGSRRELFVDHTCIDRINGARLQLHHPVAREIAVDHDAPWEGTGSGYHSVFLDGDLYRMYYKAWSLAVSQGSVNTKRHPLYCCYAESNDGIQWRKPELDIHPYAGFAKTNIVMASGKRGPLNVDAGHPAVFKDDNPDAAADAKYKAIVRSSKPNGLLPFKSPDGIHWSPMTQQAMLVGLGAFDSQNLAFWDPNLGKYRGYWRIFADGVRGIRTATSDDLIHWGPHTDLTYEDSPAEHLYTNQIKPYHRAPHILIGFPTRYVDRGWSAAMRALPERELRELRSSATARYGTAVTEALFMASRNGTHFTRWNEAFLRPGIQRPDAWHYGHQYIAWHAVETRSHLPGAPNELSLYAGEGYWHGTGSLIRRYSLRLDGFVSVNASMKGGELLTRPLTFSGSELRLNVATSAAGVVRVELQNPDGTPIPGHTLADCDEIFGDALDRPTSWQGKADLSSQRGKPVRLRFQLKDADLFAFQFHDNQRS